MTDFFHDYYFYGDKNSNYFLFCNLFFRFCLEAKTISFTVCSVLFPNHLWFSSGDSLFFL